MERNDGDRKIDTKDLPQKWERTTTQQPEEFIDKDPNEKDKGDIPGKEKDEVRRRDGNQETA